MRSNPHLGWYFRIFDLVARVRIAKNDIDLRAIHAHLTMVLSTGVLMWSYTALASLTFQSSVPGVVSLCGSLVHLLSPFLFWFTSNASIVCTTALMAGFALQMTFTYYTGGFDSHMLMWIPLLPLLAGFIAGRRSLILWTSIVTFAIGFMFALELNDFVFPFDISQLGYHWAQGLLLFGWLFIIFCTTWVHISMKDFSEESLKTQGKKIDDLFRVLFHDLANSLGRINIGLSLCEREEKPASTTRGLQVIGAAQTSMIEITQNVRRMYALSKGKEEVKLSLCPLNPAIEDMRKMFATEIDRKKIQVLYDDVKNRDLSLLVDPVSFSNQVIGNIISNAIKFSDHGGTITISACPANHQMVSFEIKDSGIGMPDVLAQALFDMNQRTCRPGTAGESGTGFGIHIMKSFVELYGGKVMIETVDREKDPQKSGTSIRLILNGEWTFAPESIPSA